MFNVIFMGTPDFAVPSLKFLINSPDYNVVLAVSQPDKPVGRKQILMPTAVKQTALEGSVEVYQPATLKSDEAYEKLASYNPDFIVVAAYGKILPQRVLDIPKYACVNLHGSLLPKYRGAAPIQRSVIDGEKESGVTTMLMAAGLDTGDILLVRKTPIDKYETAGELFDRIADMCPEVLDETLKGLAAGTLNSIPQDDSLATHAAMLNKEEAVIDWNNSAEKIHNLIRGTDPWPVARTYYDGRILKLFGSDFVSDNSNKNTGELFKQGADVFVKCGENSALKLKDVMPEGSKRMSAQSFINGHKDAEGKILG